MNNILLILSMITSCTINAMDKVADKVDISELDKVEVLRVLYERAKPLGMGFRQYRPGSYVEL